MRHDGRWVVALCIPADCRRDCAGQQEHRKKGPTFRTLFPRFEGMSSAFCPFQVDQQVIAFQLYALLSETPG